VDLKQLKRTKQETHILEKAEFVIQDQEILFLLHLKQHLILLTPDTFGYRRLGQRALVPESQKQFIIKKNLQSHHMKFVHTCINRKI
jgi:hypothetical protein